MDQFLDARKKNRLFNVVTTLGIMLIVFVAVLSLNGLKENSYIGRTGTPANVITLSGTGKAFAVPDTGTFTFSVIQDDKTVALAQDTASKKINSIIAAVKAMGVADTDIKTESYNAFPKYDYLATSQICTIQGYCPPGGKQVLSGYEVSQTISVKVRKTADAGAVLSKVGELGASNISGLNFVVDNMDAINATARNLAIADAKAKAQALAKSLGVSLGRVVSFQESGNQPPIYYAMDSKVMGGPATSGSVPPQVPTGENTVTSNVSITYEIN